MAPIPLLRQSNSTVSSARAPHGTHGTARKPGVGIGIRADNSGPSGNPPGLASPPLIVALVAVGLLSLTMFSMFGRRVLEASRHRRRNQDQGVDSETSARGEDHYLLLADMLGLSVAGHMRRRTPRLPVPDDIPKMWDIRYHARPPGVESHKEHPLYWGDITPIAVMVSKEERRSRVRNSVQATPSPQVPRSDRRACRLFRWLCRRGRRRMPVGESEAVQDEQEGRLEEKSRALPRKDMQVIVAIAMPCRPRRISSLPLSEIRRDQDVPMSYFIGVHAIPWSGEDL